MRKLISLLILSSGVAFASQDTALTMREVRDPRQLKAWLEANAQDAETRLVAAGATATSSVTLTNGSNAGACSLVAYADGGADAGDYMKLLMGDNGGFAFQTDKASAGTLATKFTVGEAGRLTLVGSATIDNDTSATVLNLTEDTVKVTGAFEATADATITGGDITGANGNAIDIGEATDGTITFSRDDAGAVTLTCVDNDANADLTVVAGGTGDITVGDVTDSSVRIPIKTTVTEGEVSRICTSADYGKIVMITSNAAVAITLPANGAPAGAYIDFMVGPGASDSCVPTIAAATADTLVTKNSNDSDSVTFGSGHRIGAYVRCISDGSFWHAMNLNAECTMTTNDSD